MEIGLDYMHIRSRAEHYGLRWTGIALLLVGIGLFLAAGSYYGYFFWLRLSLNDYNAQRQELVRADAPPVEPGKLTVRHLALPPGVGAEYAAAQGFTPTDGAAGTDPDNALPPAAKLRISALDLKVDIKDQISLKKELVSTDELIIRNAVQVKDLANPGAPGALWFLGPAGNVADSFSDLKDAPDSLNAGGQIQIIVSNGEHDYLYLATHSDVIPDNKFNFSTTDRATVHLAVPVPNGVHDHFLILSGELVGMR